MKEVIFRLVDNSEFEEYKENYGKSIICGYSRIDGWAIGIVANQREIIKTNKGEVQFGGVIYIYKIYLNLYANIYIYIY